MSPIKPVFILYLIVSSFTITICSTIDDSLTKQKNIPKEVLEKVKEYVPEIAKIGGATTSITYAEAIFGGINKILTTLGNGIAYASSSIYTSLLETLGAKVAGCVVLGTWAVIIVGSVVIVYKMSDSNHYVKVKEFEYHSSDKEDKSDRK